MWKKGNCEGVGKENQLQMVKTGHLFSSISPAQVPTGLEYPNLKINDLNYANYLDNKKPA